MANLDLARYFEFVLTSGQIGYEKPDAQFFESALDEIQNRHSMLPHEIIYVGDHYDKDVIASQQFGMSARWIVRDARDIASGDTHFADDVKPLRSLRDLVQIVDDVAQHRVLDVSSISGANR